MMATNKRSIKIAHAIIISVLLPGSVLCFGSASLLAIADPPGKRAQHDAQQQRDCSEHASSHVDPERIEQAARLIAQAKDFKLQASKFRATADLQSREAQKLSGQAQKLNNTTHKLNAKIRENVKSGEVFKLGEKQYQLHLDEFSKHSKLYSAHLAEYDKQLHQLQITNAQLESSCKEYADHVQKYHIPGLRPPHVCLQLQWEQKDMQRSVRGYQEDQIKVQKAEASLADQEAKLAQAAREHSELEKNLLQKANFDELERTQGFMLLKEYQQIEREYRMLQQEKKAAGIH